VIVQTYDRHPNVAEEINGEPVNDALYERDAFIAERYSIEFKYSKYESLADGTKLMNEVQKVCLAAEDVYDLIIASPAHHYRILMPQGILLNLKDIPYLDLRAPWWSQAMYNNTQINNNLYTLSGSIALNYYYAPCVLTFNIKIADAYNLGNLYKYVFDGSWTLDKFSGLLKDTWADLNGDGVMKAYEDQFALSLDDLMGQACRSIKQVSQKLRANLMR